MKEFLLNNDWIFGVFGLVVMYLCIHFRSYWVGEGSKLEDVLTWYAFFLLVYGSVMLWTDFLKCLIK